MKGGLDRFCAPFVGSNTNGFLNRGDKDLAVTNLPGLGGFGDGPCGGLGLVVAHHHFNLDLGEEVDGVLAPSVDFRVAFLAAKALHLTDGHPFDSDLSEAFLNILKFEGFDNRFYFFHSV